MRTLSQADHRSPSPAFSARVPIGLTQWRVLNKNGRVLGNVLLRSEGANARFVARRYHHPSQSFYELGSFWSAEQAEECLRNLS